MSTTPKRDPNPETILTLAIERLLRKIIRFLIGKVSLVKLQEITRYIYLEESERRLRLEKPGRNVPLTRLALLTGLDTRTLAKTRNNEKYRRPLHQRDRFLKTMTPESCVLDVWLSNPKYFDEESGEAKILHLNGDGPSFESLVRESIASRGVTLQSILDSLQKHAAVFFDEKKQQVQLVEKILAPFKAGNEWGALEMGLLHVCSLMDTVFHNFSAVRDGNKTYYQRGCWTHRLNIKDKVRYEREIRKFLKITDMKVREIIEKYEEKKPTDQQVTAGVSMFYFQEEPTKTIAA